MLKIKVFGAGHACYQDQLLPGFPGWQPWLLLCYLVLHRQQVQPRERLAAVFWGEYSTGVSRKHLRNTLWRVRQLLQSAGALPDDYLLIDDGSVSFSPSGRYSLDVESFETVIRRHQHLSGRDLTPDMAWELEQAVGLYTGDLLAGVYEDWCLVERERLNLLYLDTISKLMVFHELHGNYGDGLAYGRRILSCDNTREKVHRQMMRLYWQADDRSAALAQYKVCAQILRDTLGIAPLPQTTELYQQMKHGQFDPALRSGQRSALNVDWARSDATAPLVAEQAIHRLHQLQATIEQVGTELRLIEQQLNYALQPLGGD